MGRPGPNEEVLLKATEMYSSGLSTLRVGRELGVSQQTVSNWLHKEGIKLRPLRKYSVNEGVFDKIDSEIKAYWAGFFLADGYNDRKERRITLTLSLKDRHHVEKFAQVLSSVMPVRDYEAPAHGKVYFRSVLSIRSSRLSESLAYISVDTLDMQFWFQFFIGYFDANGYCGTHINKYHGNYNWEFSIAYRKKWEYLILHVLDEIGVNHRTRFVHNIFDVRVSGKHQVTRVLKCINLYKGCRLDRKKKTMLELLKKGGA